MHEKESVIISKNKFVIRENLKRSANIKSVQKQDNEF
jgi:hypothetical protein